MSTSPQRILSPPREERLGGGRGVMLETGSRWHVLDHIYSCSVYVHLMSGSWSYRGSLADTRCIISTSSFWCFVVYQSLSHSASQTPPPNYPQQQSGVNTVPQALRSSTKHPEANPRLGGLLIFDKNSCIFRFVYSSGLVLMWKIML